MVRKGRRVIRVHKDRQALTARRVRKGRKARPVIPGRMVRKGRPVIRVHKDRKASPVLLVRMALRVRRGRRAQPELMGPTCVVGKGILMITPLYVMSLGIFTLTLPRMKTKGISINLRGTSGPRQVI